MNSGQKLAWGAFGGLLFLVCAASAQALEISLEENRAQRGNIGYVDIQKIFRLYPETAKAKTSFAEIMHQSEEQINLKKAELLTLRSELAKLNMEHDLLQRTPISAPAEPPSKNTAPDVSPVAAPKQTSPPPAVSTGAVATQAQSSTAAATESTLIQPFPLPIQPLPSPFSVSTAAATRLEEARLPGMSRPISADSSVQTSSAIPHVSPIVLETPTEKLPAIQTVSIAAASSATAAISAPAIAANPIVPSVTTATVIAPSSEIDSPERRNARLKELEDAIADKIGELGRKEAEFKEYQTRVEKNLTDVESRRSEMLLAKIYNAVREVARENGVSVIVDKTQIMFGANTVDLTDKVIKKLESLQ